MIGKPGIHGRNLAVGQERRDTPTLLIASNRSIPMISAPGPVINADDIQPQRRSFGLRRTTLSSVSLLPAS
jgi:hypothetical protein